MGKVRQGWWPFGAPAEGAKFRLICLPYAGGGASVYRRWRESAPPGIDVCPLQLPGREGRIRERAFQRMEPLAEAVMNELRPWTRLPYAVFGHSMGALIGFEAAHRARALGLPGPRALFVSASRAPHVPAGTAPLHSLPDAEFVSALRDLDGTPEAVLAHAELMELLLPVLRADFEACETYARLDPEPLDCPIIAFRGVDDPSVSESDTSAWSSLTKFRFEIHSLPGGHFFLDTQLTEILQQIHDGLARAGESAAGRQGKHDSVEGPARRPQPGS